MKLLALLLTSILSMMLAATTLHAQQSISLQGIIGMEGGEMFSYDLTASSSATNEYVGTVKTYALKNKEVLAEVTLKVNPEQNTVELTETKILGNQGFQSNVTICLVRAILTYDRAKGVLRGPIITQTAGEGVYCAIGNVTFMNGSGIAQLFGQAEEQPVAIEKPKEPANNAPIDRSAPQNRNATEMRSPTVDPLQTVATTPQPMPAATPRPKEITEGKGETLRWKSEQLILDVYDDNTVDGDMISIFFNNKEVLSNYRLKAEKKRLVLNLGQSELNILVVKAMNMGGDPPNTAMLLLYDGDVEHKIKAYNDPGKSSEIRIIYEFEN